MTTPTRLRMHKKAAVKRYAAALLVSLSLNAPILVPKTTKAVANYVDHHYDAYKLTAKRDEIKAAALDELKKGTFNRGEFIIKTLTLEDVIRRTAAGQKVSFSEELKKNRAILLKRKLEHIDINEMDTPQAMAELKKRTAGEGTAVYGAEQHNALESIKSGVPIRNCYSTTLAQMALTDRPMYFEVFSDHVQPTAQHSDGTWHSSYDGSHQLRGDVYSDHEIIRFYKPHNPFGSSEPFTFPTSNKSYSGAAPRLEEFSSPAPNSSRASDLVDSYMHDFTEAERYSLAHIPHYTDFTYLSNKEHLAELSRLFQKPKTTKSMLKFDSSKPYSFEVDLTNYTPNSDAHFISKFPDIQKRTILMTRFRNSAHHLLTDSHMAGLSDSKNFVALSPYQLIYNGLFYLEGAKREAKDLKRELSEGEFPELHAKLNEIIKESEAKQAKIEQKLRGLINQISPDFPGYEWELGGKLYLLALANPRKAAEVMNEKMKSLQTNAALSVFVSESKGPHAFLLYDVIEQLRPHLHPSILSRVERAMNHE